MLHPHGLIPNQLRNEDVHKSLIEACLLYSEPTKSNIEEQFILTEPESLDKISKQSDYDLALRLFPKTYFTILIGYSFATQGRFIDDWCTFNFLKNLHTTHKRPILIIDPNSKYLVDKLREEYKQHDIYGFDGYWNLLSQAIIDMQGKKPLCDYVYKLHIRMTLDRQLLSHPITKS